MTVREHSLQEHKNVIHETTMEFTLQLMQKYMLINP